MYTVKQQKYNPSNIKPNSLSSFYLYEVYAIPLEIREKYYNKLKKRKNANKQKNVKLLKIIYNYVEKEDFDSWNIGEVCKTIGFKTANQLYWQKSKILKELRNMFFKWNEKEKEIEESKEYKGYKHNSNEVKMIMMKVRKMEEIGMRKESKYLLCKIFNKHEKRLKKNNPLILSEVYENLMDYYSAQGNLKKFNAFYRELKGLFEYCNNRIVTLKPKELSVLKLRYLLAEANKSIFHSHSLLHLEKATESLEKALLLARKYSCWDYQLLVLDKLKSISKIVSGVNKEKNIQLKLTTTGYDLAVKRGFKLQKYAFLSEMIFYDLSKQYSNEQKVTLLKKIYEDALQLNPVNLWTHVCLSLYLSALINIDSPEWYSVQSDILTLTILHSFKTAFILYSFGRDYGNLINKTKNFSYSSPIDTQKNSKIRNPGIIVHERPDNVTLNNLEDLLDKTTLQIRNTNQLELKTQLLLASLEVEFWRGVDFNYEKAESIVRKIERISKKWEIDKSSLFSLFHFLKIGLKMFEEARLYNGRELVLEKYLKPFSDVTNQLIQKKNRKLNICYLYLFASHLARELNYPELWEVVEEQWKYLARHQPQVITSLKKQL